MLETKFLAMRLKLKAQWKIIHDFKPTEYLDDQYPRYSLGVSVDGRVGLDIFSSSSDFGLELWTRDGEDQQLVESNQLPRIGEWTRIEISHEEEDGKFFLSFGVAGRELERKEATDLELQGTTDVAIGIGLGTSNIQPGLIRRLVVLQKE